MPNDAPSFGCPLIPLTVALMGGIVIGNAWPDYRGWAIWAGGLSLFFLGVSCFRRRPSLFSPLFLFVAFGYLLIQPWAAPRFPPDHITRYIDKGAYEIVGCVVSFPQLKRDGQSFIINTGCLIQNGERIPVRGKLRISVSGVVSPVFMGDQIRFNGSLRSLKNFKNPGGFDYKQYMAAQGVWASSYARGHELSVLEEVTGKREGGYLHELRRHLSGFLVAAADPETVGVFLALLLGDMGRIQAGTRMAFQRIGIGHVLSISGLHVGIVGGTVFFLFSRVLAFFPWFPRRGWIKHGAAIFAILAVWIYGLLAGMAPATQRSVYMTCVFFCSFFVGRRHILINAVAVAAMIIFICDPPSLFSISCQLSFAAVIAMVLGIPLLGSGTHGETTLSEKAWRKIKGSVFISASAFLGTLPLVMRYFQEVSTIGFISNLLFVPLIEMCVLPMGLLSLCLVPISPPLAAGILLPADRLLSASLGIAEKVADWPFSSMITVLLSDLEVSCYYVALLLLIHYLTKKKAVAGKGMFNPKQRTVFFITGVAVLAIAIFDIGYWYYQRFWRADLRVAIMDVGDGAATLLELPGGKTMLIDGGGFSDNSVFDVGKSIVAPFLLGKKIRTVDELILSHPDSDHLNGLIFIAENFHVKRLRCNNENVETEGYRRLKHIVQEKKIQEPEFSSAPRSEEISGVTFKFLYPPADYSVKKQKETWRKGNNNSVVVHVRFGDHSFLFPGDIEADAEAELVKIAGDLLGSEVLIAPHHGSRTSGTTSFLNKVHPQRVVISTGVRRWPVRPHPEALARYRAACPIIYCTANQGAVQFSTDGRRLREWVTE
ncbi:MAG: DNA internalization-related competence protein ComEC/Rec2 [Pseudomonadota bacterium]